MWGVCEACFLLALGLILSDWRAPKWRPSTLILEENHTPSGVSNSLPPFPSFISSIFPLLHLSLCSYVFPAFSTRFPSCFYVSFHVHLIFALHHQSSYTCIFLLPSRSESSHLLNHLVKFVCSENLLWISHHIIDKNLIIFWIPLLM